jgi:hypothetical protein
MADYATLRADGRDDEADELRAHAAAARWDAGVRAAMRDEANYGIDNGVAYVDVSAHRADFQLARAPAIRATLASVGGTHVGRYGHALQCVALLRGQ